MSKKNWGYQTAKQIGKILRSKVAFFPNKKQDNNINSLVHKQLDEALKKPLKGGARRLTGLFYVKGKDSPAKGSLLYTLFYILLALLFITLIG